MVISLTAVRTSITPVEFMVAALRAARLSMDQRHHTPGLAPVPEPSAVLTMAEIHGGFPPAEGLASEEAAVVAEDATGSGTNDASRPDSQNAKTEKKQCCK
jgi:hypothetical protein